MRHLSFLLLAGLALPAAAETSAEIRAVTLSTAGLALIEAEGQQGREGVHLAIRRADIDDFLKSLRLSDPAGGVSMLTLSGPGGLHDTFDALPFTPEALQDLRALVGAMTGAPVEATRRGTTLSGALMGTRTVPCATEGAQGCIALSLRDSAGTLRQILLDEATEITFSDATDRAGIGQGLEALRQNARALVLDVRLTSTQDAPRPVQLGWLQPAPVWKTAWRAEDGPDGLHLTGWAVVENTTGQDWDDVTLTLATGAVQALDVQLYERLDAARKLAMPQLEPAYAPEMARGMMFEAQMDMAPVAMDDGDAFSRYTLTTPVNLRAGEMMSLPFLNERLEEARLTLYRGSSGAAHPMIAIEFENPLPLRLPAGVVTLYEEGRGHAGDAMLPELAPGARDVIEFAQDTAVGVREDLTETQRLRSARIVAGVLVTEDLLERRTRYRFEGAPQRDTDLTLEHPLRAGWDMQTPHGTRAFEATRFQVTVPAGEIVMREVVETRMIGSEIALLPLDVDALASWSSRVPDPDLRAVLEQLQDLRSEESLLRREIAQAQAREAELVGDQDRLVGLIVQLGDDSPATRERRDRVDAIEAEIAQTRDRRDSARDRVSAIADEIRALLQDT